MAGYIFVCYAHEDTQFALKLARHLQKHGLSIWLDQWNLVVDDEWEREISKAMHGCISLLVILSPAAVNSWVVQQQLAQANQLGKRVISVLCRPSDLPSIFQNILQINFTNPRNYNSSLEKLLKIYSPDQDISAGYWPKWKKFWEEAQPVLLLYWRYRLRPLLWPGWLGPVLVLILLSIMSLLYWTQKQESLPLEPEIELLAIIEATPTPAPTPTPIKTRFRTLDNGIVVEVPGGEFLMGSSDEDNSASNDEKPQRLVFVDTFWIDKTEITNAQYNACVEANVCTPSNAPNKTFQEDSLPVVGVTWEQAQNYCHWVGGRLPTEAEWEKAARGTDGRRYPWGDKFDGYRLNYCDANCVADWRDRSANDGYRYTAPVGSYPTGASPYGVLDMSGNVWEWTADWYASDTYEISDINNPMGPDTGLQRVIRGGSWLYKGESLRIARRHKDVPTSNYDNIGFRCVISEIEQAQLRPEHSYRRTPSMKVK